MAPTIRPPGQRPGRRPERGAAECAHTMRAMNAGGTLRLAALGSLSLISSPIAAIVKIEGVTACPRNASGVPCSFSQPSRAAQQTAAGAVIARNPAATPMRNAST